MAAGIRFRFEEKDIFFAIGILYPWEMPEDGTLSKPYHSA
jgi:hypothetical protein